MCEHSTFIILETSCPIPNFVIYKPIVHERQAEGERQNDDTGQNPTIESVNHKYGQFRPRLKIKLKNIGDHTLIG